MTARACLLLPLLLSFSACRSGPPTPPLASSTSTAPAAAEGAELSVGPEHVVQAFLAVPGARTHSLQIQSPESVRQIGPDTASAEVIASGVAMTLTLEQRQGHWAWVVASSPKWGGQTKSPQETVAWLNDSGRRQR